MKYLQNISPLALLLAALAVIFGVALFNHGPVPSMEPRFAEAVREMIARHEYLIPVKNGIPYIEYPPLYFWLAIGLHLAGLPLLAAIRLPGYIALGLWVIWLSRLQQRVFPDWPRLLLPITGVALPGVIYNFFMAQSDSVLMLGVLIAFTGFFEVRRSEAPYRFPWELWLGITLGALAKGPVAIVITLLPMALEIVTAAWLQARGKEDFGGFAGTAWRLARPLAWVRGLLLLVAITVPWYIAAGFEVDWTFVRGVFLYQNFTRFFVGFDHRQPWWIYGETLWPDLFPLSLLLLPGLWFGWRRIRELEMRTLLIWTGFTILFFSISASKQSKYILPAAPAMAALALAAIPRLWSARTGRRIFQGFASLAALTITIFAFLVIIWLPEHDANVGGAAGYARIRAAISANPGRIVSFHWPRSMALYELGAPMDCVHSSRQFYERVHAGGIRPGDYLLVNEKYLPGGGESVAQSLIPPPAPPGFTRVLSVRAEDSMALFRVTAEAPKLPVPPTPEPPPRYWWQAFDTD